MRRSSGWSEMTGTESGTGLLNAATVTANGAAVRSEACEPLDPSIADGAGSPGDPADGAGDGTLPRTGGDLGGLGTVGLVCLCLGAGALAWAVGRRRAAAVRPRP